jgi:hypothetical protein
MQGESEERGEGAVSRELCIKLSSPHYAALHIDVCDSHQRETGAPTTPDEVTRKLIRPGSDWLPDFSRRSFHFTVLALKFVYYLDGKKAGLISISVDISILAY